MFIETKKLQEAISFIKCITEGLNPVTGRPDDSGLLTHPDTLRNMFFILDILDQLSSGELISKNRSPFPYEILAKFHYIEDKGITGIIRQIYSPIAQSNVQKLTPQKANQWLNDMGYIEEAFSPESNTYTYLPTEIGKEIGIYAKTRDTQGRRFVQIYYSRPAQEFLIENFEKMMNYRKSER